MIRGSRESDDRRSREGRRGKSKAGEIKVNEESRRRCGGVLW